MGAPRLCAGKTPEVFVETGDLEEHGSDHGKRLSLPFADSEAGYEGGVYNLVDDAIWVEKEVLVLSGSGGVDGDDSGRPGAHGDDIRKCGAETILLGYPHVDGVSDDRHRVRTWLECSNRFTQLY